MGRVRYTRIRSYALGSDIDGQRLLRRSVTGRSAGKCATLQNRERQSRCTGVSTLTLMQGICSERQRRQELRCGGVFSCTAGSNSDWIRWQRLQWGGMFSGGQSRCFVPSIHGENKVQVIEYKAEPLLCPVDPPRFEGYWRSTEIFKPFKRRNP